MYNADKKWYQKINIRSISDIVVLTLPILIIFLFIKNKPTSVVDYSESGKIIETKVDALSKDNKFIVDRIYEMEKNQVMFFDMINTNNELLKKTNREILKIKKIYNDKITNVNGYDVSQLDSFFTKRYAEYYNR